MKEAEANTRSCAIRLRVKRHSSANFSCARRLRRLSVVIVAIGLSACATPPGEVASWPITNAEEQAFTGQVVDILCELNGNCVESCGKGTRQLALQTEQAGTVLMAKNLTNYSGAADELWQLCGQDVQVSGLFTEHQGIRFFQVQNVRPPGGQWEKATRFAEAWAERSGKPLAQASNWQEHDERVRAVIERDGYLGLGPEADREYFK